MSEKSVIENYDTVEIENTKKRKDSYSWLNKLTTLNYLYFIVNIAGCSNHKVNLL